MTFFLIATLSNSLELFHNIDTETIEQFTKNAKWSESSFTKAFFESEKINDIFLLLDEVDQKKIFKNIKAFPFQKKSKEKELQFVTLFKYFFFENISKLRNFTSFKIDLSIIQDFSEKEVYQTLGDLECFLIKNIENLIELHYTNTNSQSEYIERTRLQEHVENILLIISHESRPKLKDLNLQLNSLSRIGMNLDNNYRGVNFNKIFKKLPNLESLDLSRNKSEWDSFLNTYCDFSLLKKLKRINLSKNDIRKFPIELKKLLYLTSIDISESRLTQFPLDLSESKSLMQINFSNNHLEQFNRTIKLPYSLESLNLENCSINEFPTHIFFWGSFPNLVILNLSFNNITRLPLELFTLKKLKHLYLNSNKITELPKNLIINNLKFLEYLDLSSNYLSIIPFWLGDLPQLQTLDLSTNNFTTIPQSFSQLTNLTNVILDEHEIEDMTSLINLPYLKTINYKDIASYQIDQIKEKQETSVEKPSLFFWIKSFWK